MLEAAGSAKILLSDNRSPELQALLEKTRFSIEEGIAKGNFTEMEKAIDSAAKEAKLDRYGIFMDAEAVYLQFHKGDNYLYQVFPRQQGKNQLVTNQ